jgi:hypothetical protein
MVSSRDAEIIAQWLRSQTSPHTRAAATAATPAGSSVMSASR